VYGIDLAENSQDYLLGIDDNPEYYWKFDDPQKEQESIYQYWDRSVGKHESSETRCLG